MAEQLLVSVFIPAYNAEKTIRQTIESVLGQTYPHYQLIVLNDASTDATATALEPFADHPKITVVHNPENLGVTRNWNLGVSLSKGNLIARLDADDSYTPDYLAQVVAVFEEFPQTDMVFTGANLIADKLTVELPYRQSWVKPGRTFLPDLLWRCPVRASSVCVKRSCYQQLGGVLEDMPDIHEDWEMWTRIAANGQVGYIARPLVNYRVLNPGGCTSLAIINARSPQACAVWLDRLAQGSLPYQLSSDELLWLKQGMYNLVMAFAAFALDGGYEDAVEKHLAYARTLLPGDRRGNTMYAQLYTRAAEVFLMAEGQRFKGWRYLLKSMRHSFPPVELGRFSKLWARALLGNSLFNYIREKTAVHKEFSAGTNTF